MAANNSSSSTANESDQRAAELRRRMAEGLLYTHSRLNANTSKALEASSFLYALIELLEEKGVLEIDDLDARKHAVAERLGKQYREQNLGAMFQDPEHEKYGFQDTAEIDCASRMPFCKAACCRLPFALSKQDIREGIVRWELGQPYLIEQGPNGYCTHMDLNEHRCSIYDARPVPCRAFDCRHDERIWLDFAQRIPNPLIERPDWPACLAEETAKEEAEATAT